MITKYKIKEGWPIIRGKLKLRFPELTNYDLTYEEEEEEEMLRNIEIKTGETRQQLISEINSLLIAK